MKYPTYLAQFESALKCKDKKEAEIWLNKQAESLCTLFGGTKVKAKENIKRNLGYMAGYYDKETALKIKELFGAVHPYLGDPSKYFEMSQEEIFEIGRKLGKKLKKGKGL